MERASTVYNLKRCFFPQSLEKSLYFIFLWLSKSIVQHLSSWRYADCLFYKHKTLGSASWNYRNKIELPLSKLGKTNKPSAVFPDRSFPSISPPFKYILCAIFVSQQNWNVFYWLLVCSSINEPTLQPCISGCLI